VVRSAWRGAFSWIWVFLRRCFSYWLDLPLPTATHSLAMPTWFDCWEHPAIVLLTSVVVFFGFLVWRQGPAAIRRAACAHLESTRLLQVRFVRCVDRSKRCDVGVQGLRSVKI